MLAGLSITPVLTWNELLLYIKGSFAFGAPMVTSHSCAIRAPLCIAREEDMVSNCEASDGCFSPRK